MQSLTSPAEPRTSVSMTNSLKAMAAREGAPAKPCPSAWEHLAQRNVQSKATQDLGLSVRFTVCTLLLALPLLLQPEVVPEWLHWISAIRSYGSTSVLFAVFSLARNIGDTVHLIGCGLLGVIFCLANVALTCFLFSEDILGVDPIGFVYVVLNGFFFVGLLLGLNLNSNAVIFGCAMFALCWMRLLRALSPGESIEDVNVAYQIAHQGFIDCLAGGVCCLFCSVLPFPLLAIRNAQDLAEDIVEPLSTSWMALLSYVGADGAHNSKRFAHDVLIAEETLSDLEALLASSWKECLVLRHCSRSRAMLLDLVGVFREACDWLFCLQSYGVCERRQDLVLVSAEVAPVVEKALTRSTELLRLCAQVAASGDITAPKDGGSGGDVEQRKALTVDAMRSLEATMARSSMEEKESALCYGILCFTRAIVQHAEVLLGAPRSEDGGGRRVKARSAPLDIVAITDSAHVLTFVRSWLALAVSVWLGLSHVLRLLQPFGAGIAFVCPFLFFVPGASWAERNASRLQGVVIGTVVGEFGSLLFRGSDYSRLEVGGLACMLGVVMALASFARFHVKNASGSYVGLLVAAFSARRLLENSPTDDSWPFEKVASALCAVLVMACLDGALGPLRAAGAATEELLLAWDRMEDLAVGLSMSSQDLQTSRRLHVGEAEHCVSLARAATLAEPAQERLQQAVVAALRFKCTVASLGCAFPSGLACVGPQAKTEGWGFLNAKHGANQVKKLFVDEAHLNREIVCVLLNEDPSILEVLFDPERASKWNSKSGPWPQLESIVRSEIVPKNDVGAGARQPEDIGLRTNFAIVMVLSLLETSWLFRRAALAA